MDTFPHSPQQQHIRAWRQAGSAYDARCVLGIDGELDLRRLRVAIAGVVDSHDILRTGYSLTTVDLTGCVPHPDPWTDRYQVGHPEDPRLLATLIREGPHRHQLVLTLPAFCADPRSMRNLAHGIAEGYGAPTRQVESVPYGQFAAWQNALAEDAEEFARPRRQVVHRTLPFESATGGHGASGYAARSAELTPDTLSRLESSAAEYKAAFDEFLLACWQIVLWQQTRHADIDVGWVDDGRVYDELGPVVGPCAKVLPVLVRCSDEDRFADVLDRVRLALGNAMDGREFFGWTDDVPAATTHPVWGFEFTELEPIRSTAPAFALREHVAWTGPFTLLLRCERGGERLRIALEYEGGRFGAEMISCLLAQLAAVATAAAANPETALGSLSSVTTAQAHRQTAEFTPRATEYPCDRLAHQLVEEQVVRTPDRTAVAVEGHTLSYAELNARANRLAHHLAELGARQETLVGICLDRGIDMVVAVLAVHKAGAAFVPIDPAHPAIRVRTIVEDTAMSILVTDERNARGLPESGWQTVCVDRDRAAIAARSGADPDVAVHPEQLAYILHTSGSTGRPKGVLVPHRAFVNFLHAMRAEPGITAEDNLVAVTTLSFDIAGLELYLPLTAGARVTVASRDTAADPLALARLLADSGATVMQATPVTWRMLVASGWAGAPGLTALIGGEALPPELVVSVAPRVRRGWNMYGPTETTIWSTCAEIEAGTEPVSVGRPIANTCVHVLDDDLRPVAVGVLGEVCIGGAGVARGYGELPGLTADRFVPDPFCATEGGRLYRTGDLGRYDVYGRLYVAGRADGQVKIRGHRIELGEVETVLAQHPAVRAAVATTRREPSGEARLEAHVEPVSHLRPKTAELRDFLAARLPAPMVPTRIALVESFPLTANGKVDRAALGEIDPVEQGGGHEYVPASTRVERAAVEVWRTVLGVERPGVTDNFFDLGGHSVLLVTASTLLRDRLGVDVTPLTLLEHPTIAALARHLDPAGEAEDTEPSKPTGTNGRDRLRRRKMRVDES